MLLKALAGQLPASRSLQVRGGAWGGYFSDDPAVRGGSLLVAGLLLRTAFTLN